MIQSNVIRQSILGILFAALMGVGSTASAYTAGACREDGAKLCPEAKTDKELIPCLKTHETELSEPCKVNLAELRQVVRETRDACQPDIEKFCKDVPLGGGRIRRCLRAHEAELTAACKTQVAAARQKYSIPTPPPQTSTTTVTK